MIGQTIYHYKILEKLGEGGMGVVYKAEDTKLHRSVALKLLPPHAKGTDDKRARLMQEAQAAAALNHPHICTIYRVDEFEERDFIEMEFVEGETLRTKLPVSDVGQAVNFAIQIAEALQEAHSKGIVHRDIKADNVMVNNRNQIKVMDFGLAQLKGSVRLTKDSSTVGTLAYMAPEQIQAGDVDHRSDIFSFGVLLFEMLTGRLPFRGDHDAALMYSVLNEEPAALASYIPEASPELERLLNRALEKDPKDRFQSAQEIIGDLQQVLASLSMAPRSGPRKAPAHPGSQRSGEAEPWHKRSRSLLVAMVVMLGGLAVLWFNVRKEVPPGQIFSSIAVLPFMNVTGDPDTEYLSDGMTEALINSLSRLPDVTVMSRSSVFRFKGPDIDPQKAGEELGVDAVMTGRITQRGENLTISAELARVSDNSHIWGEVFNRNISDVLLLQSQLATKISHNLQTTLSGEEESRVAKQYTDNPEAYQLYLKGLYFWNKRTVDDLNRSVDYFTRAIEVDPGYSLAYAGLSDAHMLLGVYDAALPAEVFPKAKEAAHRALSIDPSLAEVHATLGDIEIHYGWDWNAAGDELRSSIDLKPDYATGYHWYSEYLTVIGRHDEAISVSRKARALDPLSPIIASQVGWNYYMARQYDSAMVELGKVLEIAPDFPWVYYFIAHCQQQSGSKDEMVRSLELAHDLYDHQAIMAALAHAYAFTGRRREAEGMLEQLRALAAKQFVSSFCFALVHHGLGNRDETLGWLEKSYQERSPLLSRIGRDPLWDPIRDEPRFVAIVEKMGLGG